MWFITNRNGDIFNENVSARYRTGITSFNCGSYALDLGEGVWYIPYITPDRVDSEMWSAIDESEYYSEEEIANSSSIQDIVNSATLASQQWQERRDEIIAGFYDFYEGCFGYHPKDIDEECLDGWCSEDSLELSVYIMLHTFSWLRQISSFDELNEDEYGVAFAVGGGDFHFVRYENGIYSHKMGSNEIDIVSSVDEAFGERYDVGTVLFAAKKLSFR